MWVSMALSLERRRVRMSQYLKCDTLKQEEEEEDTLNLEESELLILSITIADANDADADADDALSKPTTS